MVKVEFHCHSCYSKDSLVKIEDLLLTSKKKGINRVVITDHNEIKGALAAHTLAPDCFIVGEEIMTLEGELIGIFMKELVPPGFPARRAIDRLREQGAFITVAHPFDSVRKGSWEFNDLLDILPHVDAIEVFNSRCVTPHPNVKALQFAQQHDLLGTVGSDAHSLYELGSATLTLAEFNDPSSLKQALGTAKSHDHLSGFWVHFFSRYATFRKRTGAKCY